MEFKIEGNSRTLVDRGGVLGENSRTFGDNSGVLEENIFYLFYFKDTLVFLGQFSN